MELTEEVEALVEFLVDVGRPRILEDYLPSSCIVSTRVSIEFLRYFGVRAAPRAVLAEAMNPAAVEFVLAHGWEAVHSDSGKSCAAAGGWMVVTDNESGPPGTVDESNGWRGHLVAMIEDDYLLDLSADQMARPLKNLLVPGPIFGPVSRWPEAYALEGGAVVRYDDLGAARKSPWVESRDWRVEGRWRPIVSDLIADALDLVPSCR